MEKIHLALEKPIAFYPQLSKALGGIKEALYFQQLYYWSDKGKLKDGWIYKTKEEIEKETTLSRSAQDRIREKFEEMEILETKLTKVNGKPTLHYKLKIPIVRKLLFQSSETYYSNSKKVTIPLSIQRIHTENTKKDTKKEYPERFEDFWEMYPRKEAKKKALTKWKSKKLDKKIDEILDFIDKAKKTDRWKDGYIPIPTTFINQERWNDDLKYYNDDNGKGGGVTKIKDGKIIN